MTHTPYVSVYATTPYVSVYTLIHHMYRYMLIHHMYRYMRLIIYSDTYVFVEYSGIFDLNHQLETKTLSSCHQFERAGVDICCFSVDGFDDTHWIPKRGVCRAGYVTQDSRMIHGHVREEEARLQCLGYCTPERNDLAVTPLSCQTSLASNNQDS